MLISSSLGSNLTHDTTGTFYIGAHTAGTLYPGDFDIGEVIFYSRFLNDDEISDIENYLSQKWGIELN